MKKILALVTALLMSALLLVGCGAGTGTSGSGAVGTGDKYKIFLITMDQMDQHWVNVDAGCKEAVKEIGEDKIQYEWLAPSKKDDAEQIQMVNNAVANKADAILIAANGPTAVSAALEEAKAQGIKVVYVDSPADVAAVKTLATDNTAAGTTAGTELLNALKGKDVTSGKIGIVNVNAATASTVAREKGFRAAFDGTDFELLETQYGEGDAAQSQQLAENFISQGVVGLFGANEGSTVGVGNAIKEDGNKIFGVGFDKSDKIMELIGEEALLCTMAQNPDKMGYEGMKVAYDALLNNSDGDGGTIDTGVTVVNKENA